MGFPSRKCGGVRGRKLLGSFDIVVMGLELRIDSISVMKVLSSFNDSICKPTERLKCRFMDFIAASKSPPKWGARGELSPSRCLFE